MSTAESVQHKSSLQNPSYGGRPESNARIETSGGGSLHHSSPVTMQRNIALDLHQAANSAAMQHNIGAVALHHGVSSVHRDMLAAGHDLTLGQNAAAAVTTRHNNVHHQEPLRIPHSTSAGKQLNTASPTIVTMAKSSAADNLHLLHSGYVEQTSHPFPLLTSITSKNPRPADGGMVFPGQPLDANNGDQMTSGSKSENHDRSAVPVTMGTGVNQRQTGHTQPSPLPSFASKSDGLTRAEIEAYVNALASRIDVSPPSVTPPEKPKAKKFTPLKPMLSEPGECEPPTDPSGTHKCEVCDRTYSTYQHLKRHSRIHDEFRPYRCDQCTKSFCDMNKLKRHNLTHTGEKPYACHICDKKVSRPEHLKRHLLTHSEMRPFKCSVCDFSARRNDSVRSHVRSKHPDAPVIVLSVDEDVLEMQAQQQVIAQQTPPKSTTQSPPKKKSAKKLKPNPPEDQLPGLSNHPLSEHDRLQRHLESLATTQTQPMNMISNIALQQMRHYAERVEMPANMSTAPKQEVSQLHQSNHDLVMSIKRGLQEKQQQLTDTASDKPKIKVEAPDGQNQCESSKDVSGAVSGQVIESQAETAVIATSAGAVPAFGQAFWNSNTTATAIPASFVQPTALVENSQNIVPQIPVPFSPHVFTTANNLTDPKLQMQVGNLTANIPTQVSLSPYFMNAIHGTAAPRMLFNGVSSPVTTSTGRTDVLVSTQSLTVSTDTSSTKAS